MEILYVDLETTPVLGHVWRAYEDNLLDIRKDFGLICFGYAWNDEPVSIVSMSGNTEKQMVKKLWELFNAADVIVAQNGDRFDIKVSNALFIRHKLSPPAPYKTVDTLKLAKRYFRFTKNSLDYLSSALFGEKKIETNISLWFECMDGKKESIQKMEEYCANDVVLLRKLYYKLRAWHTGNPNQNLYQGSTHKCPACGGDTQKRGLMYTRVGKYQRHQCKSCGSWSKGEKIKSDKVIA
jgi:DNA polymerase elongation subunit (family B)